MIYNVVLILAVNKVIQLHLCTYIIFYYVLSQDIAYSSPCCTVGPCVSILYITVYICGCQAPSPFLLSDPLGNHKSVLDVCESVSVHKWFHLCWILDPIYKWYTVIFLSFWLTLLSMIISRSILVLANGVTSFFLWLSSIPLYLCTIFSLSIRQWTSRSFLLL